MSDYGYDSEPDYTVHRESQLALGQLNEHDEGDLEDWPDAPTEKRRVEHRKIRQMELALGTYRLGNRTWDVAWEEIRRAMLALPDGLDDYVIKAKAHKIYMRSITAQHTAWLDSPAYKARQTRARVLCIRFLGKLFLAHRRAEEKKFRPGAVGQNRASEEFWECNGQLAHP